MRQDKRQALLVEKAMREIEAVGASARLQHYDLLCELEHLERRISEEKERLARG